MEAAARSVSEDYSGQRGAKQAPKKTTSYKLSAVQAKPKKQKPANKAGLFFLAEDCRQVSTVNYPNATRLNPVTVRFESIDFTYAATLIDESLM